MSKLKKRKPREKIPKAVLAAKVFRPLYKFLSDLHAGEVDEVNGEVVIASYVLPDYPYLEASETLIIWCDLFETLCKETNTPILCTTSLRYLSKALLEEDIAIHEQDIKKAKIELDAMYSIWLRTPIETVRDTLPNDIKEDLREHSLLWHL